MGCGNTKVNDVKKILIIVGPSGVGKGTLINKLKQEFPDKFVSKISYTTRYMREGEEDGKHYYFVNEEVFQMVYHLFIIINQF
jgi:guanylate kinase